LDLIEVYMQGCGLGKTTSSCESAPFDFTFASGELRLAFRRRRIRSSISVNSSGFEFGCNADADFKDNALSCISGGGQHSLTT
jgi:hypothetical protein